MRFRSYEDEFRIDRSRFYYEPRAFWSVASIDSSLAGAGGQPQSARLLPAEHFKNGSRYPIRLTHVLMSPIGYLLRQQPRAGAPADLSQYDNAGSIITKMQVRISAPYSDYVTSVDAEMLSSIAMPTAEPAIASGGALGGGVDVGVANPQASGLFGVTRWDFEIPFDLFRRGGIQLDTSIWPTSTGTLAGQDPVTSVLFQEEASDFKETARIRERAAAARPANGVTFPAGASPTPYDAFAFNALAGGVPTPWASSGLFPLKTWRRQDSNRGSEWRGITGFAVAIDQITMDDAIAATAPYNNVAFGITPMSQRMICRARCNDGGTGEWWWREGAPIALVTPTITPALCYRLADPIWLGPGDALQVEMQAPLPSTALELAPTYNAGLSLCGYAVVEK